MIDFERVHGAAVHHLHVANGLAWEMGFCGGERLRRMRARMNLHHAISRALFCVAAVLP